MSNVIDLNAWRVARARAQPFASNDESMRRRVLLGFSLSYDQLVCDYSKTNYSSARAAMKNGER